MTETTPQQRAEWKADARRFPDRDLAFPAGRILALLADLEAAERSLSLADGERDDLDTAVGTLLGENAELEARAEQAERERDDLLTQQPFRVAEANRLRAEQAEAERDRLREELDEHRAHYVDPREYERLRAGIEALIAGNDAQFPHGSNALRALLGEGGSDV
jgi:chromosome segregation ATPase